MNKLEGLTQPATTVFGSSSLETVMRLPQEGFQHDGMVTTPVVETTYGGAGLCNAVALKRTGVFESIGLFTVAGEDAFGIPDRDGFKIEQFAQKQGIEITQQAQEGSTETSIIFLNGTAKKGVRVAEKDGSILRDSFRVDHDVLTELADKKTVVASSFKGDKVAQMAEAHLELHNGSGLFIWTMNGSSSREAAENPYIQRVLKSGAVSGMFMSATEEAIITSTQAGREALSKVPLRLVSLGSNGARIDYLEAGVSFEHTSPAQNIHKVANDNGAGEALHANFLATLFAIDKESIDHSGKDYLLQLALAVGNLAASLKVQQSESLWFPTLNYELIKSEYQRQRLSPMAVADLSKEHFMGQYCRTETARSI